MENKEIEEYELTVLYDENCTDYDYSTIEGLISKYFIIQNKDDVGRKRLAYQINNKEFAHYILYTLIPRDNSKSPSTLTSQLNIKNEVMRYLLCKVDVNKLRR